MPLVYVINLCKLEAFFLSENNWNLQMILSYNDTAKQMGLFIAFFFCILYNCLRYRQVQKKERNKWRTNFMILMI